MNFEVHNWGLEVGNVSIEVVSSSSVFLIGDNDEINLSSFLTHRLKPLLLATLYRLPNKEIMR